MMMMNDETNTNTHNDLQTESFGYDLWTVNSSTNQSHFIFLLGIFLFFFFFDRQVDANTITNKPETYLILCVSI